MDKTIYIVRSGAPDTFGVIQALFPKKRVPIDIIVYKSGHGQDQRPTKLILTEIKRDEQVDSGDYWQFNGQIVDFDAAEIGLYPCKVKGSLSLRGMGFEVLED